MDNLTLNVIGVHPITLKSGVLSGHMLADKKFGIGIDTVFYPNGKLLGGCISYEDSIKLRDFLNKAIAHLDELNSTYDWSSDDS